METKFKNVLITGASSGIGEAMALYYAASGSENLFICGRNKERLNEVKHQCEKFGAKLVQRKTDDKIHFKAITVQEAQALYVEEMKELDGLRKIIHQPCKEVLDCRLVAKRLRKLFEE